MRIWIILLAAMAVICPAYFFEGTASAGEFMYRPIVVGQPAGHAAVPITLPDGTLKVFFFQTVDKTEEIAAITSTDNGQTWSEPETVLKLSGKHSVVYPLLAQDGEIHLV